jgi:hypothetical protein
LNERSQLFIRSHNETLAAVAAIMVSIVGSLSRYKPPFPIPETQSAFHPPARRNVFRRRDARQQSRLFARCNQSLRRFPNSNRLAEIVSDDFSASHPKRLETF